MGKFRRREAIGIVGIRSNNSDQSSTAETSLRRTSFASTIRISYRLHHNRPWIRKVLLVFRGWPQTRVQPVPAPPLKSGKTRRSVAPVGESVITERAYVCLDIRTLGNRTRPLRGASPTYNMSLYIYDQLEKACSEDRFSLTFVHIYIGVALPVQ